MFEGLEWEVNDPIDKLKRMIWGGQALRVLDDRLSASLSQIHNAKEALDHTIKQVCMAHYSIQYIQKPYQVCRKDSRIMNSCKST